jgi:hypothetical protein
MSEKPIALCDYLIDHAGINWSAALNSWHWLVPREFTLWLVNRIADLFIVLPDGTIHMLDVGGGTLEKIAESRHEFCVRIDEEDNANAWLAIPLVDKLEAAGVILAPGQCYAFKQLPILGGDYVAENFSPLSVGDWVASCGSIHEQLRDVPDGTHVSLKVVNPRRRLR